MRSKLSWMFILLSLLILSACNLENEDGETEASPEIRVFTATSEVEILSPSETPVTAATANSMASATFTATLTFTPTLTPTATTMNVPIIGQHQVRSGENYFCIGRAYGVLPDAIEEVNDFRSLIAGDTIDIPRIQWNPIPPGPVCQAQFSSPFPVGVPRPTETPAPVITDVPLERIATTEVPSEPTVDCTKTRGGCR